jgi:hypothetical protein
MRARFKAAAGLVAVAVAAGAIAVAAPSTAPAPPVINLEQARVTIPSPQASDRSGDSVAIDGDTMVLGSPGDDVSTRANQGSATIYVRDPAGVWSFQQQLFGDATAAEFFGRDVAVSGDTIVVGADGAATSTGAAYIFTRSGSTWSRQQRITASDGAQDDQFGKSVAISRDTIIVGALLDDTAAGVDAGSAYVFNRSGTTWTQNGNRLFASDAAAVDRFGTDVAIDGATVVVGAPGDDTAGGDSAGSAYVFILSAGPTVQQGHLFATDGATSDSFAARVDVDTDTVVVGARFADRGSMANAGAAYVFVRSSDVWAQQTKLLGDDTTVSSELGAAVSIDDDVVVVGAPTATFNGLNGAGVGYTFTRSGAVWTQRSRLVASDASASSAFGISVDVSGSTAAIGAPTANNSGEAFAISAGGFVVGSPTITEGTGSNPIVSAPITLPAPYPFAVSVEVRTDPGTAAPYADYTPVSKTLTFSAGQTRKTVNITVNGDSTQEASEVFGVVLANAFGAPIDNGVGVVTITDDDTPPPTVSIADASKAEGNTSTSAMQFTVTLSAPASSTVTVRLVTADGTAVAPGDYTAKNESFSIPAGTTSKVFSVPIVGDTAPEPTETFTVTITSPVGATIADGSAVGTITDTD